MPEIELSISTKFRQALPPMSEEEHEQLEKNIVKARRVLDPIKYWADGGKNWIVDGMNRYGIARKHKIPYDLQQMEFGDEQEVIDWIVLNALGRRNMNREDRKRLAGELYNRQKRPKGVKPAEGEKAGPTCERIAEAAGVSRATVIKSGRAEEIKASLPAPMVDAINAGQHGATEKIVFALGRCNKNQIASLWGDVRTGRQPTFEAALKAQGVPLDPPAKPKPEKPVADKPTPWDNVPVALHERLKELKVTGPELKRLASLNMDDQAAVVEAIKTKKMSTVSEGLNFVDAQPVEVPVAAKPATLAKHIDGMARSIDQLRIGIDRIVQQHGRPNPDFAQQMLDGLEQARKAAAKWARKA